MNYRKPTAHEVRRIAVAAAVDPRTVRAFLEGRPIRSTTESRITDALRLLGLPVTPAAPSRLAD